MVSIKLSIVDPLKWNEQILLSFQKGGSLFQKENKFNTLIKYNGTKKIYFYDCNPSGSLILNTKVGKF